MKKFQLVVPFLLVILLINFFGNSYANTNINRNRTALKKRKIIIFVWDGLRPDSITAKATPNLYRLAHQGTWFAHNHSSYPTFTMMNAASFATGDFAGKTGFYGNTLWDAKAKGTDSSHKVVDFQQPVFTEDYHILQDLNQQQPLVQVYTLFIQAHKKGIITAAVGKSGPAFFQDYKQGGVVLDEKHAYPLSFAKYLQAKGYPLPVDTVYTYSHFKLNKNNGNPTAFGPVATLKDGVTADPTTNLPSAYDRDNEYLMHSFLTEVIPYVHPRLSVVWLRNPDTTEHNYGLGVKAYYDALRDQDKLLGRLLRKLKTDGTLKDTDIIVVSDHGHSNVSGALHDFPLRAIKSGKIASIARNGYSVSGDIRPADLLHRAGFTAFDGSGCQYDPVLSGIKANGKPIYPTKIDTNGKICGAKVKVADVNGDRNKSVGIKYTTPAYRVPKKLPKDAIIVAANGGSTYFYVPSHNDVLIKRLVRFLQSNEVFGAIFVDPLYGNLPGTFTLPQVKLENKDHRNPDIIVGSAYRANTKIQGFNGIEYNSSGSDRGMHGSFSPVDVHNTLVAFGPDFKSHFVDTLPSGNVDVAPTIAYLLGLNLPNTDGRPLLEALKYSGMSLKQYRVKQFDEHPLKVANNLVMVKPTDPNGKDIEHGKHHYTITLQTQRLQQHGKTYTYFDFAKAERY